MVAKKILIGLIVLVLLAGIGGALWWLLVLNSQTTGPAGQTTPDNSYYNGGSNQTVAAGPGSTQTRQALLSDLGKEYNALFKKILAARVDFVPINASSTGEAASLYAVYAADVSQSRKLYPLAANLSIQVGLTDLNNDGVNEAFVYESLPGFCGTAGCPLDIYKKEKGKWAQLFSATVGSEIGVSNTLTNGYLDLFLTIPGSPAYQSLVERFAWSGSAYKFTEMIALWDGSTFKLTQTAQ